MTQPRKHYDIASALVIADGHIAMVRQSIGAHDFWSLPGGGREEGESMLEAARRELREEAGLDLPAAHGQLACICDYTNDADHSSCHVETFVFTVEKSALSPQDPDGSITDARWLPRAEAITQLRALPWPMMGEPAIHWLETAEKTVALWRYAIDAQGRSVPLGMHHADAKNIAAKR